MVTTRLGKRYAKSLLDLSKETGKLEEVKADVETMIATIGDSRELKALLKSPVIKADKKIRILKEIFGSALSTLSMQFLEIITRKGRESHLESIARGFLDLYRTDKGISKAVVTTAYPLGGQEREKIKERLAEVTGQQIEMEERTDPRIIGGMTLRVGDKQYNGSIAHQLEMLRRQFKDNLYVPEF